MRARHGVAESDGDSHSYKHEKAHKEKSELAQRLRGTIHYNTRVRFGNSNCFRQRMTNGKAATNHSRLR